MSIYRSVPALAILLLASPAVCAKEKAKEKPRELVSWYRVTIAGKIASFYSEATHQQKAKGLLVTSQKWLDLGKFPADYTIDTLTTDDEFVTPVSFDLFYSRRDLSKEFRLSGDRKREGVLRQMVLTMTKRLPDPGKTKKTFPYPVGSIFHTSLPRFLARKQPGLYAIEAIMEDVRDLEFNVTHFQITRTNQTKELGGRSCELSYLESNGAKAEVWVTKDGSLCLYEMKGGPEARIEPTTEDEVNKVDPPRNLRIKK